MKKRYLFPISCLYCGNPTQFALCPTCIEEWKKKHLNIRKHVSRTGEEIISCCYYHSIGGNIIRGYKYGRHFDALPLISEAMHQALLEFREEAFDWIIPVPQSWRKTLSRGFHPVELIGDQLSKIIQTPLLSNVLRRRWVWSEKDQAGLDRSERLKNLSRTFYAAGKKEWETKKKILLIDDVFTTGTTIFRCQSALKEKHPSWNVKILVFAHG